MKFRLKDCRVGVVGLGYVGLPLAVEFGKQYETVGFDIKPQRIAELSAGKDSTLECSRDELESILAERLAELAPEIEATLQSPAFVRRVLDSLCAESAVDNPQ